MLESIPIWQDYPAGSTITVKGPDGSTLITYTTTVAIPAGSTVTVQKP